MNVNIQKLQENLLLRLPELFAHFQIEVDENSKMYYGVCPIHEGSDNYLALTLYKSTGIWKCNTHCCHEEYCGSILGFVRGVLSRLKGSKASFPETLRFCTNFLNKEVEPISNEELEKQGFIKASRRKEVFNANLLPLSILDNLIIPSPYYISRGYSKHILNEFKVGDCNTKNKPMYNRAVVPIFDESKKYVIGCTGRSIYDKCSKCGQFHSENEKCPSGYNVNCVKWRHSNNLNRENLLFNLDRARQKIEETGTIIINEGPGDTIKMCEAGFDNSVSIFGNMITDGQLDIIHKLPISVIILALDNDKAGETGQKLLIEKLKKLYNVRVVRPNKKDFGDLTVSEIQSIGGLK